MKKAVFWALAPCSSCVNRRFGRSFRSYLLMMVPRSQILLSWRWRRNDPQKRRFTQELHGATTQKTAFFSFNIIANDIQWNYIVALNLSLSWARQLYLLQNLNVFRVFLSISVFHSQNSKCVMSIGRSCSSHNRSWTLLFCQAFHLRSDSLRICCCSVHVLSWVRNKNLPSSRDYKDVLFICSNFKFLTSTDTRVETNELSVQQNISILRFRITQELL
jgi:hypothetical protein